MNIRWVKSRSKNNNITQAYLRWYEGGKQKTGLEVEDLKEEDMPTLL